MAYEDEEYDPLDDAVVLKSDVAGIYLPKEFIEGYDPEAWGIAEEDADILLEGPDHEHYWDVWGEVLNNAEFTDKNGKKWILYQDGDLFAIPKP